MAHNLFGDRFGDSRQPAWHELGTVFEKEMSASAAYKKIGKYEVRLEPATADGVALGKNAILRSPTSDDPTTRVFGIVGEDYTLITPEDICSIWDEQIGQPVETIGALGRGETFFLSTHLPTFSVKGDEVENYLLASNPMTGLTSATLMETPVRAVCQNTLLAAEGMATQKMKIVHDDKAKQRMAEWLRETYEWATTTAKVLEELFTAMAAARVKDAEARKLFEFSYPNPKQPARNAPAHIVEQREKWWLENVALMERRRDGAKALFQGMGTGMDVKAAKGTLWGAYNAVVETEDYRRSTKDDANVGASALFGERAAAKRRAFKYAVDYVSK